MSITERKNKDGTISFKIEASNGYKINIMEIMFKLENTKLLNSPKIWVYAKLVKSPKNLK